MDQGTQRRRTRRNFNDLVMAEMFLVQAAIESATVIGDGISELGRRMSGEAANDDSSDSVQDLLQRIADEAVEPYTTRFRYLRDLRRRED